MTNETALELGRRALDRLQREFLRAHEDDDKARERFNRLYLGNGDESFCCGEDATDQTKYRFWWPFRAIVDEVQLTLLRRGLEPSAGGLYVTVDPVAGDTTYTVVHTRDRVMLMYACSSWNFCFTDEGEFATFLGEKCQAILTNF